MRILGLRYESLEHSAHGREEDGDGDACSLCWEGQEAALSQPSGPSWGFQEPRNQSVAQGHLLDLVALSDSQRL